MAVVLTFLAIAIAVVAVAVTLNAIFTPRLKEGPASHGTASAVTLLALLISPTVAALLVLAVAVGAAPVVYGATMYFYAGYAVGLVCFIVLNRHFRRIATS